MHEQQDHLARYLHVGRDALRWKVEGASEYDVRRPLTPTGTNLLGLLKHVGSIVGDYFGVVFDRPTPDPRPWFDEGAEPNADMWATEHESREWLLGFYDRSWAHADETIGALPRNAPGRVPWWPDERADVTLEQVMVHVLAEVHRHAGHADIVRELADNEAGLAPVNDNLAPFDEAAWAAYRARLEEVAARFRT